MAEPYYQIEGPTYNEMVEHYLERLTEYDTATAQDVVETYMDEGIYSWRGFIIGVNMELETFKTILESKKHIPLCNDLQNLIFQFLI